MQELPVSSIWGVWVLALGAGFGVAFCFYFFAWVVLSPLALLAKFLGNPLGEDNNKESW